MAQRGELTGVEQVRTFALAGRAFLTLQSEKTGTRFTYRITMPERQPGDTRPIVNFVSVLSGPDNEASYSYMGVIGNAAEFRRTGKSKVGPDASSFRVFDWFWQHVRESKPWPTGLHVFHEGRCGRCGRTLTVPESITTGFGPECAGILGIASGVE